MYIYVYLSNRYLVCIYVIILYICLIILGSRRRATDGIHAPQRPFLCRAHTRSTTYNIRAYRARCPLCGDGGHVTPDATLLSCHPSHRLLHRRRKGLWTHRIYHHHLSRSAQANLTT